MNNNRDGFSGFLDGYKAQNLASVVDSASIQIKQMQETAKNLQKKYLIDKLSYSFWDSILIMNFTSQSLMTVGEGIKTLIIKDRAEPKGLHKDNEFKMLVLNYMSIVQLYGDNKIIDIALEVGDLLNC